MLAVMIRLSNERDRSWRFTKKGDKRPRADVEAKMASQRRNIRARQEIATERSLAEARKRNSTARAAGQKISDRMLTAMQPGQWYGMGDMMRLAGAERSGRSKVQVMLKRGWVSQAQNPAWEGVTLNPQEIMAGAEPHPQHLYRLTETGMAERTRLSELIGNKSSG